MKNLDHGEKKEDLSAGRMLPLVNRPTLSLVLVNIKHGDKFPFLWLFGDLVQQGEWMAKMIVAKQATQCTPTWAGASRTLGRPFPVQSGQTVPTTAQSSQLLTAHHTLHTVQCTVYSCTYYTLELNTV